MMSSLIAIFIQPQGGVVERGRQTGKARDRISKKTPLFYI